MKNIKYILLLTVLLVAVAAVALIFGPGIQAKGTAKTTGNYQIQITEICTKNESIIADNSGKYRDYIELYNPGEPVDLTGFALSDGRITSTPFQSLHLGKNEYRVIFLGDDLTGFSLSSKGGDTLRLLDDQGKIVVQVSTSVLLDDQVMVLTGQVYKTSYVATPGFANDEAGLKAFTTGTKAETLPLQVTEVLLANTSTLPDEKGIYSDVVELRNTTDETIYLGNYCLSDRENQRFAYRLPDLALAPGALATVICDGENYVAESFIHANFGLSHGENLYITDSTGATATVACSYVADNESQLFIDGAWTTGAPSPGFDNTDAGVTAFLSTRVNEQAPLVVSEVLLSSTGIPVDGKLCDAVEILNKTDSTVSTFGWYLSDGSDPYAYPLPAQDLEPGKCLLIVCSPQATGFGLSEGETVFLTGPDHRYAPAAPCVSSKEGLTVNLTDDGYSLGQATPGVYNEPYVYAPAALQISEVMTANSSYLKGAYATTCDWIELYNAGTQPIDLSGYCITDDPDRLNLHSLPAITLEAGSYCVIFMSEDGLNLDKSYSRVPMNLSSTGERLYISKDGIIQDYVMIPALSTDASYGRAEGGFAQLSKPTPNAANTGVAQMSTAPVASTPQGSYDDVDYLDVTLSAPGKIYYTTTAYAPNASSILYEGPIRLTKTTVIRAICIEDGKAASPVLDLTYVINENDNLPVVTIVSNPDGLFSAASGIYVAGLNPGDYPDHTSNYWQDWERQSTVSLFETDGSAGFSVSCGVKIFGAYSRVLSKKSLSFHFRDKYGAGRLEYPLFGDSGLDTFESFILRSGGQDTFQGRMRDEVITSIASEQLGLPVQNYRPVVVYINGQYWGLHYIREKVNENYVYGHYGIDPDTVNIAEWTGVRNAQYNAFQKYVRFHDMNEPEYYNYALSQIDMENYVDYMITEMWIGNTDNGNTKYFTSPELPWTWVLFDVDFAFYAPAGNDVAINLKVDELGAYDDNCKTIAVRLLTNPEFKDYFLKRFAYQINEVWTEDIIFARMDEIQAMIEPDMAKDCARWGQNIKVWYDNIETMRYFVKNRNKYIIRYVQNYFGLTNEEMAAYGFPGY